MALTPEEQALFEKLVEKQSAPAVVKKAFSDIGDVLRYLVANHPGFTANPDDRQVALDVVNATYPPADSVTNESN